MSFFSILFDGKKEVSVATAVSSIPVDPQKQKLASELKKIDQSYKKINKETRKMKESIDVALAIALSTGGLSGK